MTVLTTQIVRLWPDPWAIGGFFVLMLTITTGLGVILGIIFQQRNWCYVCPIGTMSNWVGKNRQPLLMAPKDAQPATCAPKNAPCNCRRYR